MVLRNSNNVNMACNNCSFVKTNFMPDIISKILNVIVGIVIIGFGIKLLIKKK